MRASRPKIDATVSKNPHHGRTIASESADRARFQRQVPSNRHNVHQEPTRIGPQVAPQINQQEVWTSTEDLFWDHMREVQNKWNTLKLNDDIWAKLIYFEHNRRLAKAYVSTPVLTIDGSTNGLDGFRIGLSGIENSYRNLDSIACLRTIGHGVKLQIDERGNILIRKIAPQIGGGSSTPAQSGTTSGTSSAAASQCSIWVKEWPSYSSPPSSWSATGGATGTDTGNNTGQKQQQQLPNIHSSLTSFSSSSASSSSTASSSSDYSHLSPYARPSSSSPSAPSDHYYWPMQEITVTNSPYKLFDMQKFRTQLERQNRLGSKRMQTSETLIDWRQCVSIISFVKTMPASSASSLKPMTTTTSNGRLTNGNAARTSSGTGRLILDEPCWIMLINIIAIDMLKSSICDNNSYNYSGPQSQVSALVDKYQYVADEGRRARDTRRDARHRFPIHEHDNAHNHRYQHQSSAGLDEQFQPGGDMPTSSFEQSKNQHQLRSSASASSLHPARRQQHRPSADHDELNEAQQQLKTGIASSERLKRLNNFNRLRADQQQAYRNTSNNSSALSSGASGFNRALNVNSFMATSNLTAGSLSNSYSSSNAIYTTFTGKYLDKQQRQRRPLNASSDDLARQAASTLYPVDSIVPTNQHGRRLAQLKGNEAPVWRRSNSPLGLEPTTTSTGQLQRSPRDQSPDAGQVRAGLGRIPFAKKSSRVGQNQLLSHSLSAFDLSHGHKLNLRSLKSSSIKMNFDSNGGDDEDNDEDQDKHDEDYNCKENGDEGVVSQRHLSKRPGLRGDRWILQAINNEAPEWADLAKKYSLDRDDLHSYASPMDGHELCPAHSMKSTDNLQDQDDGIQKSSSTISSNGMSEVADVDGIELARSSDKSDATAGQANPSQQQQAHKKISRSSLASAASSSSGCADNDYFVSQSSSSMSSSIRTSEGGDEIPSQPASSSGITSDDCGRQLGEHNHGTLSSDSNEQKQDVSRASSNTSNRRETVKDIQTDSTQLASDDATVANDLQCTEHAGHKNNQALDQGRLRPRLTKRQIKSVSLNRGHNAKTVELADHEIDTINCQHCGFIGNQHQLEGDAEVCQELCDCAEPIGDDHDRAHDEFVTCDCCYDCLYQTSTSPSHQQQQNCHDEKLIRYNLEGLCDCGAADPIGNVGLLEASTNEEPIYDQLPRFGQSKPRKSRGRPAGVSSKNTSRTDLSTLYDDFNDVQSIPMPVDKDISGDTEQNLATRKPKRNNGWLERRKYVRLFPKFMFSSSSSASSSSPSPAQADKGQTKRRNGELDLVNYARNDQSIAESRRSRSSQNLLS